VLLCILFGEHACVYGHTAVAAAISDLRILVHASLHSEEAVLDAILHDLPSASGDGPVSARVSLHKLGTVLSGVEDTCPRGGSRRRQHLRRSIAYRR